MIAELLKNLLIFSGLSLDVLTQPIYCGLKQGQRAIDPDCHLHDTQKCRDDSKEAKSYFPGHNILLVRRADFLLSR